MKSSKVNIFITALLTTITLAIITHPNLTEEQKVSRISNQLISLNIK